MTVKRYETYTSFDDFKSRMVEEKLGTYVTYSDYQKLVAENAAMRKAINETIGWQESVDASNTESVRLLVAIQTPATDEFTAELRAQGVDEAAESAPWLYGSQMGVQVEAVPREELIKFAANLRAGRKG